MFSIAYQTINAKGIISSHQKTFKTENAMEKFIDKLVEKDNFYRILATCKD